MQTSTVNTKWFKQELAARKMSLRELAKKMQLDPGALSLTLRGKRRMSSDEAHRIGILLGVPLTEVLRHAGVPVDDDIRSVPLRGKVDAQGSVSDIKTQTRYAAPPSVPASGIVLQVRDAASHCDGWLLFVDDKELPAEDVVGQLCAVELTNGKHVVGTVKKGYESNTYNVVNKLLGLATTEHSGVKTAAPVLWIRPQ